MKKKQVLNRPYFPSHKLNKMKQEGDVASSRQAFLKTRFRNLDYLLLSRFSWMNQYLQPGMKIIEIGAGSGFSELYLKERPLMSDVVMESWLDLVVDATKMDLADHSVDCFIASQNIHHFYSPYKFFQECERVLAPCGLILIQEISASLAMRVILRMMRHEGWSYDVDVYDPQAIVNDPEDPWSANCAVPDLLFEQPERFEKEFKSLKIEYNQKNEFLLFPLSGGVISKVKVPLLPAWMLHLASKIDQLLTKALPDIFALGRSVVIRKKK